MEKNDKVKTTRKSLVPLFASIVALAVCSLCTLGIWIYKTNQPDTESTATKNEIQIEQNESGEMIAKNEATLRKLLAEDTTYTIEVSEDINVTKPLEVNGAKTLVGNKSIIMDLNTEAKEKVLSVSADAKLVLDGPTIDGNGVSSGIAVKNGGTLECLSGNIVYPMPYGIVTEGVVNVEDITIDRSMHTGIYVEAGGELYMNGGQITNCIQTGIATSTKAYAKVSKDTVIQKSAGSLFYNFGTLDITGGTFSESYSNCIYNKGELNIISESDKLVEFFNSGRSVISSVAGTTVTIDGLYVHDIAAHVMNLEKDSVGDLKNILVENAGKSAFYTNSSKLTMKDVEIKDGKSVGINLTNKSTVELENITLSNGGHRGIVNDTSTVTMKNITVDNMVGAGIITIGEKSVTTIENAKISKVGKSGIGITGGTVTAKDIEIIDAAGTSIYTTTEKSKTTIDGAKLVNSGKSAIGVSIGTLTAKNVEINGTKNTGVYIQKDAKLNLSDATIKGVEKHGVANYSGTVAMKNVTLEAPARAGIFNQGTLTGEKVTINKAGSRAMSLTDASTTNVKGLVINESKNQSVYVDGVKSVHLTDFTVDKSGQSAFRITKSTDVLLKSGKITNANGDGIWVSENAKMKVQDTVITAPTGYGVSVKGTAEVTAVNVEVNDARAGFANNGGTIVGNTLAVNDSKSRSLNLLNKSTTSITGLTVKNAGDQGVYIEDVAKVVLKEIHIDTTKGAAIRASKSQNVLIKTGTIKNAGSDGVYVCEAAAIKVEAVDILDSAGYGMMAYGAELTANSINVKNAKAGLVNNGGTVYGKTISIDTTTSRALNLISGSTTTIDGLIAKNAEDRGVYVENSTVTLSNFTVDKTKLAAVCLGEPDEEKIDENAVENVILTDGTIKNSGSTGIYIAKTASSTVTGVTIENAGQHGIQNAGGKLTGTTLTINQSTNRALTMSTDSEAVVNGLNITGTGNQAVYVDGGKESKVQISGFNISDSTEAAVRIMNTKDVKLTDGTINATTYGIAISGTASAVAEDVRILRQENNTNYLVWIMKDSSLTMQNGEGTAEEKQSLVDGQEKPGIGVWIEKGGSFNLKGGTIANSKGNTSEGAGVYVCDGASFVMDGGVIENNETTNSSAGVAVRGIFTLNGGTIQKNKAFATVDKDGKVSGGNGAGVMVRGTATFAMSGGTIKENTAEQNGGGIYIQTSTADVNITGGTIEGNTAKAGGGIYMNSTKVVNMSNATITANTAEKGAGVYIAEGTFAMSGGSIMNHGTSKNPSDSEGAGVYVASGTKLSMSGGTISNNHTTVNGAGVATYGTFNMSGASTIQNNTTTSDGGGVYIGGGTYTLNNGSQQTIYNNQAKNGGGVAVAGTFTLKKGVITGNTAAQNGGGVCVVDGFFELTTTSPKTISSNTAVQGAGVYVASESKLNMGDGTISNNHATENGGGVATYGTFNMSGTSTIQNNIATSNGGGVYVGGGKYTMNNSSQQTIYQNQAKNGAGVYVAAGEFLMKNGTISTNTSTADGAGVWLNEGIGMEMTGGKIINNTTSGNGGAIAGIGNNALKLTGGEISGNDGKTVDGIFLTMVTNGTQVTMNVGFNMGQNDIRFNNVKNSKPILIFVGGSTLSHYTAANKLQIGLHNGSTTASAEFECESAAAASAIVKLLNSNNTNTTNNNHKWTFSADGNKIIATK